MQTFKVTFKYDPGQSLKGKEQLPTFLAKRPVWKSGDLSYSSVSALASALAYPSQAWKYKVTGTLTDTLGNSYGYALEEHRTTLTIQDEKKVGGYLSTLLDPILGTSYCTLEGEMEIEIRGCSVLPSPAKIENTKPDPGPGPDPDPPSESESEGGINGLFDEEEEGGIAGLFGEEDEY